MFKIRLMRAGPPHAPSYRVVVVDTQQPLSDAAVLEQLGEYDPSQTPARILIDTARMNYWTDKGADLSPPVRSLFKKRYRQEQVASKQAADDPISVWHGGRPNFSLEVPSVRKTDESESGSRHVGFQGVSRKLATGVIVGPDDSLPIKRDRYGKCKTCGRIWELSDAKCVCLDWEQVDAYHYYCSSCYVSARDPYFYQGLLVGETGSAIVDQKDWRRF